MKDSQLSAHWYLLVASWEFGPTLDWSPIGELGCGTIMHYENKLLGVLDNLIKWCTPKTNSSKSPMSIGENIPTNYDVYLY